MLVEIGTLELRTALVVLLGSEEYACKDRAHLLEENGELI